jgi:crotonobetainyl-CoA:carnitine CoA-transferase CaiB-like acyl-CoA transferase
LQSFPHGMTQSIFTGLKILDLSTVLAGPSVATFFAELGADVTKVENPKTSGDVTRSWKLQNETAGSDISAYFASVNFGKKYVWMDISKQENRSNIENMIRASDILICNFKKGDDIKFSLSNEEVFKINPTIIYAKIKGFEYSDERVAYDVVLQAETGFMVMNGTEESGPVKMPVAMMDVMAAHQLKEGILCALIQKQKDNKGSIVECSLEQAGLSALVNQASNYLMAGHVAKRIGSLHPNIAPYGEIFYCKDDKTIVLAVGSEKQFHTLVEILGASHLTTTESYKNNQFRVQNRKALTEELKPLFKKKTRNEWIAEFNAQNVPVGAIKSMDEVMNSEAAKSMILEEEISGVKTKRLSSVAFSIARNNY